MKHYQKGAPFVVVDGGNMLLYTPTGELVTYQIGIEVTDNVDEIQTYKLTGICNIVGSKNEMEEIIKGSKPKEKKEYPE